MCRAATCRAATRPLLLVLIGVTACEGSDPGTGSSPGGMALVTTTAGVQPDGDGYTIMVDGEAHGSIGPNDSLAVTGIDAGSHAVELADIEFNCATLGQFTRTVTIASDAESVVKYSLACDALSRSRIAFVGASDAGGAEVFLVNADGSDVISLKDSLGAVPDPSANFPAITWSSDGNRAAWTRDDGGLYATSGDGAGVIQLAPRGVSPIWSADGRKVAFLAADPGTEVCCWSMFVTESDGSAVTRLTEGVTVVHYDFAANGSLLVYEDDPATTRKLIVIRPDGTGRREIVPSGACCPQLPRLSPDGTKVAYFASPEAQDADGPGSEIYVSPTDGSGATIDVSNNPGDDWWPIWSPDGTKIAFVSSAPGEIFGLGSLHVVNADGTGQMVLTPAGGVWQPAWSPDGSRIAYAGGAGDRSHIFVANADGSGASDITPNRESSLPSWTGR